MIMKFLQIFLIECIYLISGKIFDPCELAKDLVEKYRFQSQDIANWICLIRWESNFDTSAVGRLNADGSSDHGLFQINDAYWCGLNSKDGACGIHCKDLENDDISDDSVCARRIFRITKFNTKNGFNAWVGWKQHCENQDVNSYIRNCSMTGLLL